MAWIGQRNNILGEGCGWVHVRHAPHNDFYRVEVTSGSDIGGTPKKWELATWRSLEGMLENRVSVRKLGTSFPANHLSRAFCVPLAI